MHGQAVYAFGFNAFGQCGSVEHDSMGRTADVCAIQTCFEAQDPIIGIAATWSASFAWSSTSLYMWGFISPFLGDALDAAAVVKAGLVRVSSEYRIIKALPARASVDARYESRLYILTDDGSLWVWDFLNRANESPTEPIEERPTKKLRRGCNRDIIKTFLVSSTLQTDPSSWIPADASHIRGTRFPVRVRDFAVTMNQGCAIDMDGNMMRWACSAHSSLFSDLTIVPLPSRKVTFRCIVGGQTHFLAISDADELFTWGINGLHGQLGHGHADPSPPNEPTVVQALEGVRVTSIAAGLLHSAVTTEDGVVYTFGSSANAQLGYINGPSTNNALPEPLDHDFSSSNVMTACGSAHTVASDGTSCYACGWNKYKQVSPASTSECCDRLSLLSLPTTKHEGLRISKIACGAWHTLILVEWAE
ncbi:hypothetical protein HDU85_005474 [Gaertneriomyces sp. JEL0708]|nr:hypothetical protein HDU85_005474 [Gaertneriomyces sp. JEL0708]